MSTGITHCLVIGIENYHLPAHFPRIRFAAKDANDFSKSLAKGGIEIDSIKLLIDGFATKRAIEREIINMGRKAMDNDRIIIYFSGHGAYESGENVLLPVDSYNDDIGGSCVSIKFILRELHKSRCVRNILFLDSCHSGFEPGSDTKDIDKTFLADELVYNSRDEEYTIGFASCQSHQKSITHPALENSVWSHFLIKALNGDGEKIYDNNVLFSDKLQTYLNKNTREFVKTNTVDRKDQTPIIFGNITDKFVIADLSLIFEERARKEKLEEISFSKISLFSEEIGEVKNLPGFTKGFHKIPTYDGLAPNNFIQEKAHSIIEEEIGQLASKLKTALNYKRKEISTTINKGLGTIETSDFDYSISIFQSKKDPSDYIVWRRLENFSNSEILANEAFNEVFSGEFDSLIFEFSKKINVTELIDRIEALPDEAPIKVNYNHSEMDKCKIDIVGFDYTLDITERSFSLTTEYATTPKELIEAFKLTQNAIMQHSDLKMLR